MAAIDNLNDSVNALKIKTGEVTTKIGDLKTTVDQLNQALAEAQAVDPRIQTAADEINAIVAQLGSLATP